jgi:DNA-binding NtrC family response regulator
MADILVVDDESSVADAFTRFLRHDGHSPRVASSGEEALAQLAIALPDLVVMDVRMPGMDGLATLVEMRHRHPDLYVVIMTAFGTSQTSIDAIRAGAFDYLTKPLDLDLLRGVIAKALASQRVREAQTPVGDEAPQVPALVGDSPQMLDVYKLIGRLASNDVPALVAGERGTGKDLVVATVHDNSARREQPLHTLDCSLMDETAIADAIFGTTEGTIHLRDVEHLPMGVQMRLARAFVSRGMRSGEPAVEARVIASTSEHLADRVRSGSFSAELADFLSVITLTLPPLRERRQDISLLAKDFARRFGGELGRPIAGIEEEALAALTEYAWPGNVAELEYAVKRACVIANGDVITRRDLGDSLSGRPPSLADSAPCTLDAVARVALQDRLAESHATGSAFHDIVTRVEEALVHEALQITRGNQVKAAELLGLNRATLRKKAGLTDSGAS